MCPNRRRIDGSRALVERKLNRDIAVNAYGPTGLIMRTNLDVPIGQPICHRVVLADGQGNTVAAVDPDTGGGTIQHFDAFGVALGTVALTGCRAPLPDRSGTGEYGYRGQEGYRTNLTDVDRPQVQGWREYGDEERSTGLMLLGARDYDPSLGRFVEADPLAVDKSTVAIGQANRWAYCANDPVNFSDPSGKSLADMILKFLLSIPPFARFAGWLVTLAFMTAWAVEALGFVDEVLGTFDNCEHTTWEQLAKGAAGMVVLMLAIAALAALLIAGAAAAPWLALAGVFFAVWVIIKNYDAILQTIYSIGNRIGSWFAEAHENGIHDPRHEWLARTRRLENCLA